jgi:two-component system repressor protein LuxO
LSYSWPGNIRELENVIKQVIVMGKEGSIRLEDLPPEITCVK